VRQAFIAALERHGAVVVPPDAVDHVVDALFDPDTGHVRRELHGQPAARLLQAAGIQPPAGVRLVVVPAPLDQLRGPLGREKLAPLTSLFTVDGDEQGFAVCRQLLRNEGAGHTALIHTFDDARIQRFGAEMPVSRILVNAPGVQGTFGLGTGLQLSMTLGCGTFGGTSTTDAVSYTHLLNIKRVAYAS
jgi:acyl-CoA reductase-like NAD-dependent aldehyde dehydrogenase